MTRSLRFMGAAAALAVIVLIALGASAYLRDQRNPTATSPSPVAVATSPAPSPTASPRPTLSLAPGTAVYCGTVVANTATSGQGSGPRTYEFAASGPSGGGRFFVPESMPLPTIGSYLCGVFVQGAPTIALKTILQPDDPGYIAPTATAPSPAVAGSITGRFAYGSDFIPPVTVYAISTADPRVWYSVVYPGFGNPPRHTAPPGTEGNTYTITAVAPGTYWVVAYRDDGLRPDPGYYSRQAECFRATPSGPCPDVTLVPATVTAGQTTSGIDVLSWGPPASGQPSPTFPPRPTPR